MSGNWKANVGAATLEQIPLAERQAICYTVADLQWQLSDGEYRAVP